MTVPATNLVECPKCCGIGTFRVWAHIANGDCFLCGSAKTVTKAQAGRWLASQMPAAPVAAPVAEVEDNTTRKTVEIAGLGVCRIRRWEDGDMRVDLDDMNGWWLLIRVEAGRVVVARDERGPVVCDGLRDTRHVVGCLQKALKR